MLALSHDATKLIRDEKRIPGLQRDRSQTDQTYSHWLELSSIYVKVLHTLEICCLSSIYVKVLHTLEICCLSSIYVKVLHTLEICCLSSIYVKVLHTLEICCLTCVSIVQALDTRYVSPPHCHTTQCTETGR